MIEKIWRIRVEDTKQSSPAPIEILTKAKFRELALEKIPKHYKVLNIHTIPEDWVVSVNGIWI